MLNDQEVNHKYVPFHIMGFIDSVLYFSAKKKYTKEYIEQLRKMPYKEYLNTEHWKMLKNAVLGRYGRCCNVCGKHHVEVHVHHIHYRNRGNEDIEDMMCICKDCHKEIHRLTNKILELKGKEVDEDIINKINSESNGVCYLAINYDQNRVEVRMKKNKDAANV